MNSFHIINKPSTVICTVAAYPEASIYWYYKDCQNDSCEYQPVSISSTHFKFQPKAA